MYRLIDLFCGAGGMSLGFSSAFESVWANDFNPYAVDTYNANFGNHCVQGDISELLRDTSVKIPKAEVVIGGPPCQGFSLLNKKRQGDERRQMWRPYLEVVERSGAQVFVMENVPQLLDSPEFLEIQQAAEQMGFRLACQKLVAADFGVAQTRKRAFIIGSRVGDPAAEFPPRKTHFNPHNGHRKVDGKFLFDLGEYVAKPAEWSTVRDAIAELPPPEGTEVRREAEPPMDLHFGRSPTEKSKARYRAIPEPGMNREDLQRLAPELTPRCWIDKKGGTDLFGRLWWDRPAFTIRTEFFKPEKGRYLHPEQHRPITHREAARFQSFPDDFHFSGTKLEIAKQIGNAVPPKLAEAVADSVQSLLMSSS